jgi:hypothetical protein
VKYFRDEFDFLWQKYQEATTHVGLALMKAGLTVINQGKRAKGG